MVPKEMPSHHGPAGEQGHDHPNETMRLLTDRASCRTFERREIPREVLDRVLAAGVHAPTGGNLQPYSIIEIRDERNRKELARHCNQPFIAHAPVLLVFCIDWHRIERWAELEVAPFTATRSFRHFWISFQDGIICAQNICTAADAMGLGSVYIGTIQEFLPEVREMFQLPKAVLPIVLLCLGYPKATPLPRRKLGTRVVVHSEKYEDPADADLLEAFREKYRGRKVEITQERLRLIHQVCQDVHGEAFAERCIERIEEQGFISPVQRYFGLHYRADWMPKDNGAFLETMREFGFEWLTP